MPVATSNMRNQYNAIDIKDILTYSIGGGNSRAMEKKRPNISRKGVLDTQDPVVVPSSTTNTPSGLRHMPVGMGFCVNNDMVFLVGYYNSGFCAGMVRRDTAIEYFSHWI
jgi:hypothetical protein